MGFSTVFTITFIVMFGLLFLLILLLRFAKYGTILGSLASTFAGGHLIVDKGGMGEPAEVIGKLQHPETLKWRLRLNYIEKFAEGQTPFIYDSEDFDPPPETWDTYAGTIKLWWDFERRNDYRDASITNITVQNAKLKQQIGIYKRMGKDLLEYFEGSKINESKEGQNLHNAKAYKVLKSIVEETNIDNVSGEKDEDSGMFD